MHHSLLFILLTIVSLDMVAQDTTLYRLSYASFLGGSEFEQARDIATDTEGNFYITGGTSSPNFPVTPGAYNTVFNDAGSPTVGGAGPMMVFVTKFSREGELIWSTFLGGPNYDRAYAIEVDDAGNVYVGGRAGDDFPTTPGAFQESFTQQAPINNLYGHQNGFISKLSPDGATLIWSSYYGSDSFGFFRDIDIDDQGNVYGILNAVKTLPLGISPNAYDTDLNGDYDMVPVKFSADGSQVIWATVLGGSGEDRGGPSIRVGPDKSVYVAGGTRSTDWPVTPNAIQPTAGGQSDMFITRLSPFGDSLIYSTYFGGSANEFSETHCLEVDHLGQAYIACGSNSTDVPTTIGAVKADKPSADGFDALLAKLSTDGSALLASTYFGGEEADFAEGLFVDTMEYLYVGGGTSSEGLPVSPGALQLQKGGGSDGFILKLSPNFDSLIYSTYWGGEADDAVRAFHVGPEGNIGFSGQTESTGFPLTPDAYQPAHASPNGGADSYFTLIIPEEVPVISKTMDKHVADEVVVYPNPARDYLSIKPQAEIERVRLVNMEGQCLLEYFHSVRSIDIRAVPPGVYSVQIDMKGKGTLIRKLVIL